MSVDRIFKDGFYEEFVEVDLRKNQVLVKEIVGILSMGGISVSESNEILSISRNGSYFTISLQEGEEESTYYILKTKTIGNYVCEESEDLLNMVRIALAENLPSFGDLKNIDSIKPTLAGALKKHLNKNQSTIFNQIRGVASSNNNYAVTLHDGSAEKVYYIHVEENRIIVDHDLVSFWEKVCGE